MARNRYDTWRVPGRLVEPWLRAHQLARRMRCSRDVFLYRQGDVSTKFYVIEKGQVKMSFTNWAGEEIIIEIMGHGAVCGEGAAFDQIPRYSSALIIQDAEVLEFDASNLRQAFQDDPELALSLLHITSLKQRDLADRLEQAYSPSPDIRINALLVRLLDGYGVPGLHGRKIEARLTHEDIAAITGLSRVTVTRYLTRLRKDGTILVEGGFIHVPDETQLSR